jgi:hypothetical protein
MNPHHIQESGPIFLFFWNLTEWLRPIVYFAGVSVAVWAFLRCRKRGYLLIAAFFVLLLFSLFAMPSINRAIQARRPPDISEQTQRKIDAAVKQAVDRVLKDEGHPIMVAKSTLHVPLDMIVLVVGVWLVARREPLAERSKIKIDRKSEN